MTSTQNHLQCVILLVLFSCTVNSMMSKLGLCANNSTSCTSRFLPNTNANESDCRLVAYRGLECSNRIFMSSTSVYSLGTMRLRTYPYAEHSTHSAFNISLTNIKWTEFRFRFKMLGDNMTFCREFHRSPSYHIDEMFYDCLTTVANLPGYSFIFQYEAEDENRNIEARKFIHKVPIFRNIEESAPLENYTPFLYVDITDSPVLTARWQQAPYPNLKYRVEVYKTVEGSEKVLEHSTVVDGNDDKEVELSYTVNLFPSSGKFHIELRVLSENCTNGLCNVSISPELDIDAVLSKTLLVGVVGCVVLIPVFLFIAFMWKRQCQPSSNARLPVVLIIHTPSRASHLKSVIALAEYLKNHCFVEALLDQLDVQSTQSKDPWTWCNDAFTRADFVMVVSSPPKCCNEEGIFKNMDLVALRFLKEKFSSGNSKPLFFSVMLPYCTKKDIPDEARNLRVFKLMRDFDQMLCYVHNGGKFPSVLNSARVFIGPRQHGGKSELNVKGRVLLTALKEAEFDREKLCNCASKKVKEIDNEINDESIGFIKSVNPLMIECKIDFEKEGRMRNISESGSTSCLLIKSESSNDFEETNIEFPDSTNMFPHVRDLDLLQENDSPAILVIDKGDNVKQSGFSVHALSL